MLHILSCLKCKDIMQAALLSPACPKLTHVLCTLTLQAPVHANWQAEFLSADAQMQRLNNGEPSPRRYKGSGTLAQGWRMASRVLACVLANLSHSKAILRKLVSVGTTLTWQPADSTRVHTREACK